MIIWDDLRTELKALVDAGMMAKLLLAEKYPKSSYGNLSLKTSVEEVLGFAIDKELSESNWASDTLTTEQKQCERQPTIIDCADQATQTLL